MNSYSALYCGSLGGGAAAGGGGGGARTEDAVEAADVLRAWLGIPFASAATG